MIKHRKIKRKIVEFSYENKLSHIGSCLNAASIIADIYKTKKPTDKFVLSQGHAGVALYAVLEELGLADMKEMWDTCGVHPDRTHKMIDCSTGSLGQGLPIALGMALADPNRDIYCLISDGELSEGSIYEALINYYKLEVPNLKIYLNYNGFTALDKVSDPLIAMIRGMALNEDVTVCFTNEEMDKYPHLEGVDAHYKVLNEQEYEDIMEVLKDEV